MASSKGEVLGTCINCEKHSYSSYGKSERLCDRCLKKLPRVVCDYCQKDFHQLQKSAKKQKDGKTLCPECIDDQKIYGAPKNCEYCNVQAAFFGSKCNICSKQEKTYGKPKMCQDCLRVSAFEKGPEALSKVGGQLLCFLCTRNYKRKLKAHEKQAQGKKRERMEGDVAHNGSEKKRVAASSNDYIPPPPPPHQEPNWKPLYDEKEQQLQKQSSEYHESIQASRTQIAELTLQLELAHNQILQKDRDAAASNLKTHELEKDLHNSHETVKALQQEVYALKAEMRDKRPDRERERERERDREWDRRDRERERERDRDRRAGRDRDSRETRRDDRDWDRDNRNVESYPEDNATNGKLADMEKKEPATSYEDTLESMA